jgi:hypothetical protein
MCSKTYASRVHATVTGCMGCGGCQPCPLQAAGTATMPGRLLVQHRNLTSPIAAPADVCFPRHVSAVQHTLLAMCITCKPHTHIAACCWHGCRDADMAAVMEGGRGSCAALCILYWEVRRRHAATGRLYCTANCGGLSPSCARVLCAVPATYCKACLCIACCFEL